MISWSGTWPAEMTYQRRPIPRDSETTAWQGQIVGTVGRRQERYENYRRIAVLMSRRGFNKTLKNGYARCENVQLKHIKKTARKSFRRIGRAATSESDDSSILIDASKYKRFCFSSRLSDSRRRKKPKHAGDHKYRKSRNHEVSSKMPKRRFTRSTWDQD